MQKSKLKPHQSLWLQYLNWCYPFICKLCHIQLKACFSRPKKKLSHLFLLIAKGHMVCIFYEQFSFYTLHQAACIIIMQLTLIIGTRRYVKFTRILHGIFHVNKCLTRGPLVTSITWETFLSIKQAWAKLCWLNTWKRNGPCLNRFESPLCAKFDWNFHLVTIIYPWKMAWSFI